MTYICIECLATFDDLSVAQRHPYRRVSKDSSVYVPMKRHVIFEATGRGSAAHTRLEPTSAVAPQAAAPFRECEIRPPFTPHVLEETTP